MKHADTSIKKILTVIHLGKVKSPGTGTEENRKRGPDATPRNPKRSRSGWDVNRILRTSFMSSTSRHVSSTSHGLSVESSHVVTLNAVISRVRIKEWTKFGGNGTFDVAYSLVTHHRSLQWSHPACSLDTMFRGVTKGWNGKSHRCHPRYRLPHFDFSCSGEPFSFDSHSRRAHPAGKC